MAAGITGGTLDVSHRYDHLEVIALKLSPEHFPLPCSLRELVMNRYGQVRGDTADQTMPLEELLGYLQRSENHQLTPLEAVAEQLEAMGDPTQPTREQGATLAWLGAALQDWEKRYRLERPLADLLLPLKPLIAAQALTDPRFFQPGEHPLHQLLDRIVSSAIGWQPQLGRARHALEQHIQQAVTDSLGWFANRDTDLNAICATFAEASERDRSRARRMALRVAETESGQARAADARQRAAQMINACLQEFPAPASIGEFLKGPWFASAQLVLLKFGLDSEQWSKMCETTHTLLDSVQTPQDAPEDRRQHIFEVVTRLPKDIKRLLLSLHHDSDAVSDAVGMIEFAHLRVLRQQPLELETIAAIELPGETIPPGDSERADTLRAIKAGQWFLIDNTDGAAVRVKLSLNMEQQQKLLFTNHAGLKALLLHYAEFADLLTAKKVTRLHQRAGFSTCLARAAGIDTVEALQALTGIVVPEPPPVAEAPPSPPAEPTATAAPAPEPRAVKENLNPVQLISGLPMGAWLGFHDGATPLLAKLAVHDKDLDMYLFVNREGLKMREISRRDLLALMEQGQVDILETRSSFRSQVSRAQDPPAEQAQEE